MSHTFQLPDAMPEITETTLLVACDGHHARLIDVGGHSVIEKEQVRSAEPTFTDRQGSKPSGSGMIGIGETDQVEEHRLKEFANMLVKHIEAAVHSQDIQALYIAAPGKFLSVLKHHLSTDLSKILKTTIDGNFMKESSLDILSRFRPDLEAALLQLRDDENFSSKKHLPK